MKEPLTVPEPSLPGEELVRQGLADLAAGRETDCALLLQIAAPRLRALGIPICALAALLPWEHALYARLETRLGPAALSYYNSLIRRMVSFAHALEQEKGLGSDRVWTMTGERVETVQEDSTTSAAVRTSGSTAPPLG